MSTNDEKMRELANRLVAMSPEPPPYPEDLVMAEREPRRRARPALLFAGAAAIVFALAAIPFLLQGGLPNQPRVGPTTTVRPTDTTAPEPAPTTTPDQTTVVTTVPTLVSYDTVVYLVQQPANSRSGNPALVPFHTTVLAEEGQTAELVALRLLTEPNLVLPPGFLNMMPEGAEILAVSRDDATGDLVIDINEELRGGAAGLTADVALLNQLIFTATQFGSDRVRLTVEGQPLDWFGSDGIILPDPVGREDRLSSVNSVIVTQPVTPAGDGTTEVAGMANVFEATVSWRILDSAGQVVDNGFTNASSGTGTWGDFRFTVDSSLLAQGSSIEVFYDSPEDGSATDVVTVPISTEEDGSWALLPPK